VMPAQMIRQSGGEIGSAYVHFSNAAQRIGVYTSSDYVTILRKLLNYWEIDKINGLNDNAEKARDYLMSLPNRFERIAERITIPKAFHHFKWVNANGILT
ncbi:MAG: acyl-ACP desaturase, partial [Bacteroidota bacterium]